MISAFARYPRLREGLLFSGRFGSPRLGDPGNDRHYVFVREVRLRMRIELPGMEANSRQIKINEERDTLHTLFTARVEKTPDRIAYWQWQEEKQEWKEWTWEAVAARAVRWKNAFDEQGLLPGTRVAIALRNCVEWIAFDQAALAAGMVSVPLFHDDSIANWSHIVTDSGASLLLLPKLRHALELLPTPQSLPTLRKVLYLRDTDIPKNGARGLDKRVAKLDSWLPEARSMLHQPIRGKPDQLATIIYTSGTTGMPKGVMLSHRNILANICATATAIKVDSNSLLLSFLPLSHSFERTAGYYLALYVGAQVAFNRSIPVLGADLQRFKPTMLVSVPRIYEQFLTRVETTANRKGSLAKCLLNCCYRIRAPGAPKWVAAALWPLLDRLFARRVRAGLGGRLQIAISGGAPLFPETEKKLLALGFMVCQGYGLTESSPVVSLNRPGDTMPGSIGKTIPGVKVRIGKNQELLVSGPSVMQGYWNKPEATAQVLDQQGWLHTGDQARISGDGRIFIIGRLKDIIVMSSGEKISPANVERKLLTDPLVSQVMVYGEGQAFLIALAVVIEATLAKELEHLEIHPKSPERLQDPKLHKAVKQRFTKLSEQYSSHAAIRGVILDQQPWTVENGLLTPTMKLKRVKIFEHYRASVEQIYDKYR